MKLFIKIKLLLSIFIILITYLEKLNASFTIAYTQNEEEGYILKDQTPNPFASIKAKQRYATLSNGLFEEMHEAVDTIQYYQALLNTKTKKIIKLLPIESSDEYKVDPVVFALSVDPLSDKYPNISPYAYCAWNPVMLIDPDGRSTNPIYDNEGNFLGSDDKGLKGEAIIMNKNSFKQGMSHDDAMKKGTLFSNLPKVINPNVLDKIKNHYNNLPNRPDYNDYVLLRSIEEMKNRLPQSGQVDYSPINVESFLMIGSLAKTIFTSIIKEEVNNFIVTKDGVVLPKGAKIPESYIENPNRSSSYGVIKNGKFSEKLRIDAGTKPGYKGPQESHIHINNGDEHFTKWPF